jgi:hypothetical protein
VIGSHCAYHPPPPLHGLHGQVIGTLCTGSAALLPVLRACYLRSLRSSSANCNTNANGNAPRKQATSHTAQHQQSAHSRTSTVQAAQPRLRSSCWLLVEQVRDARRTAAGVVCGAAGCRCRYMRCFCYSNAVSLRAAEAAPPQDAPPRFEPADVFVGIICGWTRHRRSLEANGFG